jgi:hypothetical protein
MEDGSPQSYDVFITWRGGVRLAMRPLSVRWRGVWALILWLGLRDCFGDEGVLVGLDAG